MWPIPQQGDLQVEGVTENHLVVFRALRMLLGPLLMVSSITAIRDSLSKRVPVQLLKDITLWEPCVTYPVLEQCWTAVAAAMMTDNDVHGIFILFEKMKIRFDTTRYTKFA
jgi:hypothetical protein